MWAKFPYTKDERASWVVTGWYFVITGNSVGVCFLVFCDGVPPAPPAPKQESEQTPPKTSYAEYRKVPPACPPIV